jgi:nucleoredoxin
MATTSTYDLKTLLGEHVINGKGDKIPVSSLEKKYLGLYFSASWCPPCQKVTPILAKLYETLKPKNPDFEIIFVNWDRNEDEWKGYFAKMPWLAMPYSERTKEQAMTKEFKVKGVPTLIFLQEGKLMTRNGVMLAMEDPTGSSLPWRDLTPYESLGSKLINNNGETFAIDDIKKKKHLGLYFSAQWCPPCQQFTPMLIETYNKLKKEGKDFEIVYISRDRDAKGFNEYFHKMPWLAIPYENTSVSRSMLSKAMGVDGIPCLVMVDQEKSTFETFSIITKEAVESVMEDPEGKEFPWPTKPVLVLEESALSKLQSAPCLVILSKDDAVMKEMETASLAYQKEHAEEPLFFLFGNPDHALSPALQQIAKLPMESMSLLILGQGGKAVSSQKKFTAETISAFATEFVKSELKFVAANAK